MNEFEILYTKVKLHSLRNYLLSILDTENITESKRNEYIKLCDNLQDFSKLANFLEAEISNLRSINIDLCKTNLELIEKVNTLAEENKHLKNGII